MTCKEVTRAVNYQLTASPTVLTRVEEHAAECRTCREMLALDRLSISLIETYCEPDGENVGPSPFWTNRLRARIQEMKQQGVSSWEAAIMGLKSLITVMGAVAIVLVAASLQSQPTNTNESVLRNDTEVEDIGQQYSLEELITGAPDINNKTSNLYE